MNDTEFYNCLSCFSIKADKGGSLDLPGTRLKLAELLGEQRQEGRLLRAKPDLGAKWDQPQQRGRLELLGSKRLWVVIPKTREQFEQLKSSPCYTKPNISSGAARGGQSGVGTSRCS